MRCGGVCGPRDWHRDLFAGRHVPAGDACGIVRGVIGSHHCKTTALEFLRKISQNFSPAGVTSPFVARAMPTGNDSVVPMSER